MTTRRPPTPAAAANFCPKTRRSARIAAAVVIGLFSVSPARSQVHSENRPPHPTPVAASSSSPRLSADEQLLLDSTNRERAAEGLQPLRWDNALAEAARQHAQVMLTQNLLLHQCLNEAPLDERVAQAGAKFSMIAENIAVGPNAVTIHDGWMHSTGHRKNILNADVTSIGIAVVKGNVGMFAVQDFSRPVESLSLEQQEGKLISLLKETGMREVYVSDDARRTCSLDHGYGGAQASFITRFEVTDLTKLPDQLLRKIKSRDYSKASVGACTAGSRGNFTSYRLAVLLN
jgi:uncharacterized protein YkwD